MRIEQLTVGWDDPTQVSWGEADQEADATQTSTAVPEAPAAPLYKCTALYSYTVRYYILYFIFYLNKMIDWMKHMPVIIGSKSG